MANQEYILAVRRDRREDVPGDWVDLLDAIEGLSVIGSTGTRAQVLADDAAIGHARDSLGSYLRIERLVLHGVQ
jgi:hypothetical protein